MQVRSQVARSTSGLVCLDECEIQTLIPIFLVVFGGVGLVKAIVQSGTLLVRCVRNRDDDAEPRDEKKRPNYCDLALSVFLFCWIIAGLRLADQM